MKAGVHLRSDAPLLAAIRAAADEASISQSYLIEIVLLDWIKTHGGAEAFKQEIAKLAVCIGPSPMRGKRRRSSHSE